MFVLRVVDGLSAGTEAPLVRNGRIGVGRAADCALQIADALASARHFEVGWNETGIALFDLGSLNGVFVNGQRVQGTVALRRGDFVQAGATLFELTTQSGNAEVKVSERAPSLTNVATMMMSAAEVADAIARTRAQARLRAKEERRETPRTHVVPADELARLFAEEARQAGAALPGSVPHARTVVISRFSPGPSAPADDDAEMIRTLLERIPATSPTLILVRRGTVLFTHAKSAITLGRDARNDVPLPTEDVSALHAQVESQGEGAARTFEIVDGGSTNGTFVNGERVIRAPLMTGTVIDLGGYRATAVVHRGRLALDVQRPDAGVEAGTGAIVVKKANDAGAAAWDPLLREVIQPAVVPLHADRRARLAKKKRGLSAADIAFTATSDVQRQAARQRQAITALLAAPVVLVAALVWTRFEIAAPGALSYAHAGTAFAVAAADHARSTSASVIDPVLASAHVTCTACHAPTGPATATCARCHDERPTRSHDRAHLTCVHCHDEHAGREAASVESAKSGCVVCHAGDPHAALIDKRTATQARVTAPILEPAAFRIDSFEVHEKHFALPGRCLACHLEKRAPSAALARQTCGVCHVQRAPDPTGCTTCHAQHPVAEDGTAAARATSTAPSEGSLATAPLRAAALLALMLLPIAAAAAWRPRRPQGTPNEDADEQTVLAPPDK